MTADDTSSAPVRLSQELLLSAKTGKDYSNTINSLRELPREALNHDLGNSANQLTFWINLYNAFFQILIKKQPDLYKRRLRLYRHKHFTVSKHNLSLDHIEHCILRRSRLKFSLGYIANPFPTKFELKYRLEEVDPRIHFALNCGAKSCPPIRYYEPDIINDQLDLATTSYLESEVVISDKEKGAQIPEIFRWFSGDFGGKKGVMGFLSKYGFDVSALSISYRPYDWTLQADNFSVQR